MDRNQLFPLEKVKSMVDLGVRFTFRDHMSAIAELLVSSALHCFLSDYFRRM